MNVSRKTNSGARRRVEALSLVELMITMTVFMFVIFGMISLHLFGLRWNEMVKVKLSASEGSRRAVGELVTDIHGAGSLDVGTGDASTFATAAFNTLQQGNAVQIYPVKTNPAVFIRYYLDADDHRLKRLATGADQPTVIASDITNDVVFTSEDFTGNVLSNSFNNRVVGIRLQFFRIDNPSVPIGPGHYYDFYQLQTKVTRRALE